MREGGSPGSSIPQALEGPAAHVDHEHFPVLAPAGHKGLSLNATVTVMVWVRSAISSYIALYNKPACVSKSCIKTPHAYIRSLMYYIS